jgi:prefoldin subunit 5
MEKRMDDLQKQISALATELENLNRMVTEVTRRQKDVENFAINLSKKKK